MADAKKDAAAEKKPEEKKDAAADKKPEEKKPEEKKADVKLSAPALIPNKPGEPQFQMKLEPEDRIIFKSNKLLEETVNVDMKIVNSTPKRQTYKIKCTSNEIFRVRPPLGFVEAGQTAQLKICISTKEVPPLGRHFFAVYHMASEDKQKTARQLWQGAKPEGVKRLVCQYEKEDGAAWPSKPA